MAACWSFGCRSPVHILAVLPASLHTGLISTASTCSCCLGGHSGPWSSAHTGKSGQKYQRITTPRPVFPHSSGGMTPGTWSPLSPQVPQRDHAFVHSDSLPTSTPFIGCLSSFSHFPTPLLEFPGAAPQINYWCFPLCLRLILREPKLRNIADLFYFLLKSFVCFIFFVRLRCWLLRKDLCILCDVHIHERLWEV